MAQRVLENKMSDIESFIEDNTLSVDDDLDMALRKIHRTDHQIIYVLNAAKECVGVLTNGDLRAAIRKGVSDDSAISNFLNRSFAYRDTKTGDIIRPDGEKNVRILPVLKDKLLVGAEALQQNETTNVKTALIMAGGFGKRMGALTKTVPKPMLLLRGRPIMEHSIRMLASQGIKKVYISVYYLAEQIKDYFSQNNEFGVEIEFLEETAPLGTAGALGLMPKIEGDQHIVVMNGDLYVDFDLVDAEAFHLSQNSAATMFVKEHQIQNPFGVVNIEHNLIKSFDEKPIYLSWINAGIYILSKEAISMVTPNCRIDMPDLFQQLTDNGKGCHAYELGKEWLDIGTPNVLRELNND